MTRIAIVDDDQQILALIEEVLQEWGWETQAFTTSVDALTTVRQSPPDAILLDVRLQGSESGWSLLHQLKADCVLAAVPVIILSGDLGALSTKTTWLEERGIGVLAKPFDLDDLYRALEDALLGRVRPLPRAT